jgi:hypothetical protein
VERVVLPLIEGTAAAGAGRRSADPTAAQQRQHPPISPRTLDPTAAHSNPLKSLAAHCSTRSDTMIDYCFVTDKLFGRTLRSRFIHPSPRCQRRHKRARHFAAQVSPLEGRRLMSALEMPLAPPDSPTRYDTVDSLSDVLFVGNATVGNVPVKQVTLHNNTKQTIYPFLYDPNTGQSTTGGYYDPFDGHNQEYRAYIGYTKDGKDYLGLQDGHSITIDVPLVFWDSGRAAIATDAADFLPKDPDTSKASPITNPFFFFYKNLDGTNTARFVAPAARSTDGDGVVMYYHCSDPNAAVNPGADAPEQLIEFTIRDKDFLTKVSDKVNPIDPSQLITLINYDVSYVDNLLLPVGMEATNVPVPNTDEARDYGWIGAKQDYLGDGSLQAEIRRFTGDTAENGLGRYFDGKGWPRYFNPNEGAADTGVGLRIPGGANFIFESPLAGIRSSYNRPYGANNHWMLSSGGDGPIQFSLGGTFKAPDKAVVADVPEIDKILESLRSGMSVKANGVVVGKIKSVDVVSRTVTLDKSANIPDGTPETFDFFSPATDPYATKLTNLWYSWAKYYEDQFGGFTPEQIAAGVSSDTDSGNNDYRILTFDQATHPELAVGMQVTGGGITALTTIMKMTTVDGVQTVYLSAPVPGVTAPTKETFTFSAPQPIAFADQTKDIPLAFAPAKQLYAKAFAATVYEVLSVFSTAPRHVPALPGSMEVVGNSIGGNVGFLPTALPVNYVNISADVRDLVKSALRGVPNFAAYPETEWYPDPSQATGGQDYNVYNLDPYVWFVHRKLGLSGYGFSFDDDTADVGANGTSTLSVAVGGLPDGFNKSSWSPSAQWGTVSSLATISQGTGSLAGKSIISLESKTVYNQLSADDPANSVVGAYVSGEGITPGTNLAGTAIISENQFVLSKRAAWTTEDVLLTFTGKPPK